MRNISDYVDHVTECRKIAARVKDPQHKKQFEDMAEAWTMLAQDEKQAQEAKG